MFRRPTFFMLLVFCIVVSTSLEPLHAQDALFDPAVLEVITPANVNQMTEIAAIGNGGPGRLTWSPDGKTLVVSNTYGLWLHNAEILEAEARFIPEPQPNVLRFSPDGSQLITWHNNENREAVRTWDVKTAQPLQQNWDEQGIAPNPDWHYWFEVDRLGTLVVPYDRATFWDIKKNEVITSFDFRSPVSSSASADNSLLLTSDSYETIIFDVSTGEPILRLDELAENSVANYLSPNGKLLLSKRRDSPILVRDARNGNTLTHLEDSEGWQGHTEITPDSQYFMVVNEDGLARLWNIDSGSVNYTVQIEAKISPTQYSVDQLFVGQNVFIIGFYNTNSLWIYDLHSGLFKTTIEVPEDDHFFPSYRLSPDDRYLATISDAAILRLWDTSTGVQLSSTNRYDLPGEVKTISPDGQMLVTQVNEGLRLWDVQTGQIIKTISREERWQDTIQFSPDSRLLAANYLGVYDVKMGVLLYPLSSSDFDLSPDGQLLALAHGTRLGFCYDYDKETYTPGYVEIIDVATGKVRVQIPDTRPEGCGFTAIAFSPDGKLLAANRDDNQGGLLLWEVQAVLDGDYTPLVALTPEDQVGDLAFSPDSSQLLAGYTMLASMVYPEHLDTFFQASAWDIFSTLAHAQQDEKPIRADVNYTLPYTVRAEGARVVGYSPDGSVITAYGGTEADWDTPMSLFNPATGDVYRYLPDQNSFVLSPDGKLFISYGDDRRLHYWAVPKP